MASIAIMGLCLTHFFLAVEIILRATYLETIPTPRKKKKSGTSRPTIRLTPNIKKIEPNFSIGSQRMIR